MGDGVRLQARQLGVGKAQAAAAKPQHRVGLAERVDALEQVPHVGRLRREALALLALGGLSLVLEVGEAHCQATRVVEELV